MLQQAAMDSGALGSRLTGAGWGGSVVSLVRENDVPRFLRELRSTFYDQRGLVCIDGTDLFVSNLSSGAACGILYS
jgi:N-acetylgalactosamine kinase